MPTALTLSGSTRKGSYNIMLQQLIGRRLAAAGADVTGIDLAEFEMPVFSQDLEPDGVPQAARDLAELWRTHDIIFIASPEYNGGLTPLTVNTIAWLSRQRPNPFRHAVFGIGGVSSGRYGTIWGLSHLRDTLTKLGALVVPTLLGVGPANTAFDEEGNPIEPGTERKVQSIVDEMLTIRRG